MHLRAVSAAIAALCATACSSGPHELAPRLAGAVPHPTIYALDYEKCRMQVALGQRSRFATHIASDQPRTSAGARDRQRATALCLAEHGYAVSRWVPNKDQKPVVLARGRSTRPKAAAPGSDRTPASPASIKSDRQTSSPPLRRRRRLA